jgi:hypothetical protein
MYLRIKKSLCNGKDSGEPEGTRTPNLLGRNQVHYPIMLRVQFRYLVTDQFCTNNFVKTNQLKFHYKIVT